ncbi:STM4015 family protein [Actinacidiphila epipremni]|uniref:Leucine-rich repeat domain-containing protein n=1 Tax=Actinacidiphila epipremni TaxID=2053013 RepID=A0ABX0ZVH0_9ACTN|nr:STM4015 family protein [Actinacidiphila epipremni]NJP48033.1 leucine-rich repeat domain-containing protein [Actinacidiphila epipremni]
MIFSDGDHLKEFGGLPVVDWPSAAEQQKKQPTAAPGAAAWRLTAGTWQNEESWPEAFARFAAAVDLREVRAIVVGAWPEAYDDGPGAVVEALLGAREHLTSLRSLFLGDMISEECEISWIHQGDVTPLLTGFPELERLGIRGSVDLELQPVRHESLRELVIQSGGLPAEVVRAVAACDFPALTTLDLWLGTPDYGGDSEIGDLAPIMAGTRLPALRHLGLRNSEIEDEVASALAAAPVVARLDVLDLSMGVLTDDGAVALLGGQPLTHLKALDLHHNYLTAGVAQRLREALEPAGVRLELDKDDAEEDTDEDGSAWRYVAVGE